MGWDWMGQSIKIGDGTQDGTCDGTQDGTGRGTRDKTWDGTGHKTGRGTGRGTGQSLSFWQNPGRDAWMGQDNPYFFL